MKWAKDIGKMVPEDRHKVATNLIVNNVVSMMGNKVKHNETKYLYQI